MGADVKEGPDWSLDESCCGVHSEEGALRTVVENSGFRARVPEVISCACQVLTPLRIFSYLKNVIMKVFNNFLEPRHTLFVLNLMVIKINFMFAL